MKKVLMIDINQEIDTRLITYGLYYNIDIDVVSAVDEIVSAKIENYDAIVIDGVLKNDAIMLIHKITKASSAPIMVISSITDPKYRLNLLCQGVDDYILKPYENDEVLRKLKKYSKLEKKYNYKNGQYLYQDEQICLNLINRDVFYRNNTVKIPPQCYRTLLYLMLNRNKLITYKDIKENVYGEKEEVTRNKIAGIIKTIRKMLDPAIITTVRGQGYVYKIVKK